IEDVQGHAVALPDDDVREGRGQQLRVLELVGRPVAVLHRLGAVEEDVGREIRLLLVLLDRVPLGPAVALPVNVPDVVPGDVFTVLYELDGEPAERRLVIADAQALDDGSRLYAERFGSRKN